jgi:hypothetical protein
MKIEEALVRNCLLVDGGRGGVIERGAMGDIIIRQADGRISRVEKSANGADYLVRHADGSYLRIDGGLVG